MNLFVDARDARSAGGAIRIETWTVTVDEAAVAKASSPFAARRGTAPPPGCIFPSAGASPRRSRPRRRLQRPRRSAPPGHVLVDDDDAQVRSVLQHVLDANRDVVPDDRDRIPRPSSRARSRRSRRCSGCSSYRSSAARRDVGHVVAAGLPAGLPVSGRSVVCVSELGDAVLRARRGGGVRRRATRRPSRSRLTGDAPASGSPARRGSPRPPRTRGRCPRSRTPS